jgi:hypothetical protein
LSVIQRIDDEEGAIFLYTILSHSSGEYIVSRFYVCQIGRPAQETGSALTYARRYALSALVGVVTDEDDDGQEATKKHQERKAQHAPAPAHVGPSGERVDEDGFQVWADWRNQSDAKAWAMALQPVRFNAQRHCDNAYDKVKEDCNPRTAQEMWKCWYRYVMAHAPAKGAVITDAELDGEEVPLFN